MGARTDPEALDLERFTLFPFSPVQARMDLDFSEEQNMLREMVRDLCAAHASLEITADFSRERHQWWNARALKRLIAADVLD